MSSRKNKLRGLGPRVVLWTTLFFLISVIGVSSTIYFLLADSLRKSDREVTERLAISYSRIFFQKGTTALEQEITPEYFVSILSPDKKVLFESVPQYIDHDFEDEDEIRQIKKQVRKMPLKKGWRTLLLLSGEEKNDIVEGLEHRLRKMALKNDWSQILPLIDNDSFEILVQKIEGDHWIKIGRSSEEREEQLSRIRYIALYIFIPFIFIGAFLSFLFTRAVLSPIRGFASTIKRIRSGDSDLRVKDLQTGDEIDELAGEFNSLLDQNSRLITNLKSSIDNVAHDLRTPLTRFRISAEDALSSGHDVTRLREALSDGLENSESILKLLNSIMDVSEAETETLKTKNEFLDLSSVIHQVTDLYQYTAEAKNISIKLASESVRISGDETRLVQAFGNLLDNAIKYSPENSQISIRVEVLDNIAKVSIRDEGPGIAPEEIDKIWERLYRADKSRSTSGLGIGLSLVKAIINIHKGEVGVKILPQKGSEFFVTLPICHDPERIP